MKNSRISLPLLVALLIAPAMLVAQGLKPIELPPPQTDGGKPLMQALKARHTTRGFKPDPLPAPLLSNLLWAAFGINRPESGKRTAPSAMNWQETDIYVFLAGGVYIYDAKAQRLNPALSGDFRASAGTQDFVKDAPLNLVYVADLAKTGNASPEDQNLYTAVDTGLIVQNVYLFCASEGLATVVRGSVDRAALAKALKLRPDQRIIVAQTVGYPKP
jgi:SagB-type dehydrogenase family enzyme